MLRFSNEQRSAIDWFNGPLLVLGTPGSGKTTVIVNRIKKLVDEYQVKPSNILVVTFTRAASISMRERYLEMSDRTDTEVRFVTFHSFFYWIVSTSYGSDASIKILDATASRSIIKDILTEINPEYRDDEDIITSAVSQLSLLACDMIDIRYYYATDMPVDDFRALYNRYDMYKRNHDMFDFDDMITECYRILKSRPDTLKKVREMYPYILVDEFQDTNRIQYEILKMISYPKNNVYVVGDDDQSIYGFRGARPEVMFSFMQDYPGARMVTLPINYRCPSDIVKLSSAVIEKNQRRYDKMLISASDEPGTVRIIQVPDVKAENDEIVRRIMDASEKGVSLGEIAVLYRTNLSPRRLMYKLQEHGIDFAVKDIIPDIFEHPVILPIVNYIRFATGSNQRDVFLTFMNKPSRYISRSMLTHERVTKDSVIRHAKQDGKEYVIPDVEKLFEDFQMLQKLSPYAAVNYIRHEIGYDEYMRGYCDHRGIDVEIVMDLMNEFQSILKECRDYNEFFKMIEEYKELSKKQSAHGAYNPNENKNAVQLMTIHSAKGLQFRNVHIMDVTDDVIPYKKAKLASEIEEERRMLYVAMTRSSESLYMYVPDQMGETPCQPSRFIEEFLGDEYE